MPSFKGLSRHSLLTVAQILTDSANVFGDEAVLIARITETRQAATTLATGMATRDRTAQQLSDASVAAQAAEALLGRQVVSLSMGLQMLVREGDAAAATAHGRLFSVPAGSLRQYTGRPQLAAYEVFAVQLGTVSLPISMLALAGQIAEGIRHFDTVISEKEGAHQACDAATAEVQGQTVALIEALSALDYTACMLSQKNEQYSNWIRPVVTLKRRKKESSEPASASPSVGG